MARKKKIPTEVVCCRMELTDYMALMRYANEQNMLLSHLVKRVLIDAIPGEMYEAQAIDDEQLELGV